MKTSKTLFSIALLLIASTSSMQSMENDQKKINNNLSAQLVTAMNTGDADTVAQLLAAGADPNTKDPYGDPLLLSAACYGHIECMRHLINAHANVDIKGKFNRSALFYAASKGHLPCLQLLIENKADLNKADLNNEIPLINALFNNHPACALELIHHGADIHVENKLGWTALKAAAYSGIEECMRLLIEKKAAINNKDDKYPSALMWAAAGGHKECVSLLLAHNADVHYRVEGSGDVPLQCAAKSGNKEIVQMLLKAGADIHYTGKLNWSALAQAGCNHHQDLSEFLVEQMLQLTAAQKKELYTLLLCLSNIDKTVLNKDTQKLIAQQVCALHCTDNKAKIIEQMNRIRNQNIKQHLLKKYFDQNK